MDDKQQLRDLRAAVEAVIEDDHEGEEMLAILIVDRVIAPLVAELTETCTCYDGDPQNYEGPHADCPVCGAVRAYHETLAKLTEAEADRDRARDAAVALEQETARLERVLDADRRIEDGVRDDVRDALAALHKYDGAEAAKVLSDLLESLGGGR